VHSLQLLLDTAVRVADAMTLYATWRVTFVGKPGAQLIRRT
jgi:hypothetical protein